MSDLITKNELRGLRAELDALIQRADAFKRLDAKSFSGDEVFGHVDLVGQLSEARDTLDKLALSVNVEIERTKAPVRQCRCVLVDGRYDISACPLHTVDHFYKEGCCDQHKDVHRHMTEQEYDSEYPKLYDYTFTAGNERYRVDSRKYSNGIGVTFTQLFPHDGGDDDDTAGLCFDFSADALPGLIFALQGLRIAIGQT